MSKQLAAGWRVGAARFLTLAAAVLLPAGAAAQPRVRQADVAVTFLSPTVCEAEVAYALDGPPAEPLAHRLLLNEGAEVAATQVSGAPAAETTVATRSRSLALSPPGTAYRITYRVTQADAWAFRCPVWLPVAPMVEGAAAVRLRVSIPEGMEPLGDSFPAFAWSGRSGEVRINNVPTVIRAPFAPPGAEVPWLQRVGMTRVMDVVAIGMLVVATLGWVAVRRVGR